MYRVKGIAATVALAPTESAAYPDATDLYRLAQAMLKRRQFDGAITILELKAKTFIETCSFNTLAQAYAAKRDVLASWKSSRRALAISQNDRTARRALGLDR